MNLCDVPLARTARSRGSAASTCAAAAAGRRTTGSFSACGRNRSSSASEGLPARVEVVEELGADAYVFCAADLGERSIAARRQNRCANSRRQRRARLAEPAPRGGASLRPGRPASVWRPVTVDAPGSVFLAEIREQPDALGGCSTPRRVEEVSARLSAREPHVVRLVGHGSSDNAASYGVYAFGLEPPGRRFATRSRCPSTTEPTRLAGFDRRRLSQSGHTRRGRVRRAHARAGRADDRGHERAGRPARPRRET